MGRIIREKGYFDAKLYCGVNAELKEHIDELRKEHDVSLQIIVDEGLRRVLDEHGIEFTHDAAHIIES